jgi:hypothetical protein
VRASSPDRESGLERSRRKEEANPRRMPTRCRGALAVDRAAFKPTCDRLAIYNWRSDHRHPERADGRAAAYRNGVLRSARGISP